MVAKKPARGGQYALVAEFAFDVAKDTMLDNTGALVDFKSAGSRVFPIIDLPVGASIFAGDIITPVAISGSSSYEVSLAVDGQILTSGADMVSGVKADVAGTITPASGAPMFMVVDITGAATAGVVVVRVIYVIAGRVNEN
jgi:hypothetical protein